MSNSNSSYTPGANPSSRRTPPVYAPIQAPSQPYIDDSLGFISGYPATAPSWGMTSAPPSPVNLGGPTSSEPRSSPTDAYWSHITASPETSYGHSGVMSGDMMLPVYYGQHQPRTLTPGSSSVVSSASDIGHGRSASAAGQISYAAGLASSSGTGHSSESLRTTGPTRRRGASEAADPQEYERQRVKKKEYAKSFRDNEKQHFEELRRRLFPTDPNTRRAECLERAVSALDELEGYKARAAQRDAEVEKLRKELAAAKQRAAELEQYVGTSQVPSAGTYQGYAPQQAWR